MADKYLTMNFKHCFIVLPRHVVDWTRHFQRVNQRGSDLALGAYFTRWERLVFVVEESELSHAPWIRI